MKKIIYNLFFNVERMRAKHNRKEELFCYNIDAMDYDEEKEQLLIKGWGFSNNTHSFLSFSIPDFQGEPLSLKRIEREDVNDAYMIPKDNFLGFELRIKMKQDRDTIKLVVSDQTKIELPIIIKRKQIGCFSTLRFVKNTVSSVKEEGISKTIDRLKVQKNRIWNEYDYWIYENEKYNSAQILDDIESFQIKPKISIVIPVYNVAEEWIRKNIESVQNQYYPNWELCLADDCSPSPHVREILNEYADSDQRIKVVFRKENGHISAATNSAIELATGDYIGFMDNDDALSPVTLYEYVKKINENPTAEFLYCDEDMIDTKDRRFNPFFKSSWNEKLLMGHNYITHFVVLKRELLDQVGMLRDEVVGSQDYDIVLRASEITNEIYHIPQILYHWRTIEGSVADNPEAKNYAYVSGKRALQDALKRRNLKGDVLIGKEYGTYKINYTTQNEFASLIVVNCPGKGDLSTKCLNQLLEITDYENYEVVAVNFDSEMINDPSEKVHFVYNNSNLTDYELRNWAVKKSKSDNIVFLSSTIDLEQTNWLKELMNEMRDPNTGIVGAKILDNEDKIWNAGMSFDDDYSKIYYTHRGCQYDNIGYYYRLSLPQYVFAVSDDCLAIKKELFNSVDGFSTDFGKSLTAIDLCLKVRKMNHEVVWNPYVVVKQLVSDDGVFECNQFFETWSKQDCRDNFTNPYIIKKKY